MLLISGFANRLAVPVHIDPKIFIKIELKINNLEENKEKEKFHQRNNEV